MAPTGLFGQRRWAKAAMLWLVAVAALATPAAASAGAGTGGLALEAVLRGGRRLPVRAQCACRSTTTSPGRDDPHRGHPSAGHRAGASGSARCSSTRAAPAAPGVDFVRDRRRVPVHARGPRPLRPRQLRPAGHHPQRSAALLPQPGAVGAVLHRLRVPDHPGRGSTSGSPPTRTWSTHATSGPARSSTTWQRRTWPATWMSCARRSATTKLNYVGYSVRHVPRRHLREPLPGSLPRARRRRRARPGRVVDRAAATPGRRRSRLACTATSARRRRWTSSSASATPAARPCAFAP